VRSSVAALTGSPTLPRLALGVQRVEARLGQTEHRRPHRNVDREHERRRRRVEDCRAEGGERAVCAGVSLYFLLLAPGDVEGGTIVSLHRLSLGQTFTISGSVLFGASFVGAAAAGV